jgi:hypothetical protein
MQKVSEYEEEAQRMADAMAAGLFAPRDEPPEEGYE